MTSIHEAYYVCATMLYTRTFSIANPATHVRRFMHATCVPQLMSPIHNMHVHNPPIGRTIALPGNDALGWQR